MLTSSLSHKIKALAVVLLAVFGIQAAASASSAQAAGFASSLVTIYGACNKYGDVQMDKLPPIAATLALNCLVNKERKKAGVHSLSVNMQLGKAAQRHAKASIAAPFWDTTNGLVSHLDPGTQVPSDANALQTLVNQQSQARILAAGYCAGGSSYSVGEITYGGGGTGSTPKAAVAWWMNDPPHKEALLNPQWRNMGPVGFNGSAFPGATGVNGTYVIDFGVCS